MELLARVSRQALEGDSSESVLRGIVASIVDCLPVAVASIILLNEAGTHFTTEVLAGELDLSVPGGILPWSVNTGAAGRCARTGQVQWIPDVNLDADYVPGNRSVRSEYLVPIRHRDRLHGVLNLESTDADFFGPEVRAVFDAIGAQVAGVVNLARVVGELEQANRRLEQLALRDGLTGIANRRCFDDRLQEAWRQMQRAAEPKPLALAMVDADFFKRLNDACGHIHGDECLRALAELCAAIASGQDDLAARIGGEEMALLLPGRSLQVARALAETLRKQVIRRGLRHPDSPLAKVLTISIGVAAMIPHPRAPAESLLAEADRALYLAKRRGRNRIIALRA